jgi:two-component system, cell cycle sensor histidine kinase and response regulator CckA
VRSLLAFGRKQIIDPRPLKINDVVISVEKILHRVIGEDIELRAGLSDQDTIVMADSGQIEQILMNMATNARDAMPGGGCLNISTGLTEIDEEYISIHGYGKPGKYALLSVSDTGAGMDKNTRERVFEPFFTTKEVGKGSGLGLSMVYGIVKQHNGYINCYSSPGQGTTFKIYLPLFLSEKDVQPLGQDIPSLKQATEGTETVLVAEDDASLRIFIKKMLEEFGYTVIDAVDGADAVQLFAEHREKIKLLLFDIIMPRKNGKAAYEEIKQLSPDIRVLFMSGYTADIMHQRGILDKELEFILKPVSPTGLLHKLREVLDKETPPPFFN